MFPYSSTDFGGNINLAIFVNLIIYFLILLTIPIALIFIISFVKPKIKKITNIYLYSFSTAMLILIGTMGFMSEAAHKIETSIHTISSLTKIAHANAFNEQLITMGILGGGAIIGLSTIFVVRFIFVKCFGEVHHNHSEHGHGDHIISFADIDNPKAAWLGILLLLSHRTIDGFILGGTVAKLSAGEPINIGLIVTFNLHILVEVLIIYYRQVQYGQTVKKAVFYNLLTTIMLLPIMLIAAFINQYLNSVWWLLPVINASGGSILLFVGVIELVPEFIHLRSTEKKEWYLVLLFFALGIVFTVILLSFHSHEATVTNNGVDKSIELSYPYISSSSFKYMNKQII